MDVGEDEECRCLVCNSMMVHLQACHLRCPNCGAEMTCGEKGLTW